MMSLTGDGIFIGICVNISIALNINKERMNRMNQNVKDYVIEKVNELVNAPTCSPETKEAAKGWLAAVGTDKEAEETKALIAELEEDLMPIDRLIAFAESEAGTGVFGDKAGEVAAHGRAVKAAGGKYCDCPACVAVEAVLARREELL